MKGKTKYSLLQRWSAGFMILALLWLTMSVPFVNKAQQNATKFAQSVNTSQDNHSSDEDSSNPFANSTEEKVPCSTSLSEEYLHDHHEAEMIFTLQLQYHKTHDADTYTAFHGELLVPPPNQA